MLLWMNQPTLTRGIYLTQSNNGKDQDAVLDLAPPLAQRMGNPPSCLVYPSEMKCMHLRFIFSQDESGNNPTF